MKFQTRISEYEDDENPDDDTGQVIPTSARQISGVQREIRNMTTF
jgi:hypothetical protein